MTVLTIHPEYLIKKDDWDLVRDALDGETAIKSAGQTHLPMPSGFLGASDKGVALYQAYQKRARFGEYLAPTVAGMIGVVHSSEEKIAIELPPALEYLWEDSDNNGTPLEAFHQSLTEGILTYGRAAVQVTAPKDGGDPYLILWGAPSIMNWDAEMAVLDASRYVRKGFEWEWTEFRRAIEKRDGTVFSALYRNEILLEEVEIRGVSGPLERFPVVIGNSSEVSLELRAPPVLGIARASVAEYQLSADYRWQLYMSGQETLVIINADAPTAVGAGVVIELKGESDGKQPDAKYVGPSGTGIEGHRSAMEDERKKAVAAGAKLLHFEGNAAESGDALRTRFRGHVATLLGVAQSSCRVLEKALRVAAELKGVEESSIDQIVVTPPKDLAEGVMSGTEAEAWVRVWEMGGFSSRSLHERLQRGGAINPERSFEEEQALIGSENNLDNEDL